MELRRDLGLLAATSVVVGSMIGVGIFLGPRSIATLVETPALVMAVWIVGGLLILCGALTYAELGSALPEAGGQYAYMREAYGRAAAFATGWNGFFVAKGAFIAALAAAFAEFVPAAMGTPLTPWAGRAAAVGLIAAVTLANALGVRHAGRIQLVTATMKVSALAVLVLGGILLLGGRAPALAAAPVLPPKPDLLAAFGLALVPVFFAYDGWTNATDVAEEVKDPRRNVPRAVVLGVGFVMLVYVLVNLTYLLALGPDGARETSAAARAAAAIAGEPGRLFIAGAILVSIAGTVNGIMMTGPRIAFAMSRDGLFFRRLAAVHPRWGTPAASIVALGAWSAFLVLLPPVGDAPLFETLATYGVFDSFIFYALGAGAVFVLRRKRPDLPRAYTAWGYPVVPAIFILLAVAFLVNTLVNSPRESLAGVGLILLGAPFYLYWRRKATIPDAALHPRAARTVVYSVRPKP